VAKSLEDWSQFRASHRPPNGPRCRYGAALLVPAARSMRDALTSRIIDVVKMNISNPIINGSSCSFARAIAQHQEDRTKTSIAAVAATLRSRVHRKFGLRLLNPPTSPAKPLHVGWSRVALEVPINRQGGYSATAGHNWSQGSLLMSTAQLACKTSGRLPSERRGHPRTACRCGCR